MLYTYVISILFILFIWFPLCEYYEIPMFSRFYYFLDKHCKSFIVFVGIFFIGYFWLFNFFFLIQFIFSFLKTFEFIPAHASGSENSAQSYKRSNVECTALLYCGACGLIGTLTGIKVGGMVRPLLKETVSLAGKPETLFLAMPSNIYRRIWIHTKYATGGIAFFYSPAVLLYNIFEKGMNPKEAAEDLYGSNLVSDASNEFNKLKRE